MSDRPKYRVLQSTFLQPVGYAVAVLLEIGAEVEFEGVPNIALRPLNAAANARKAASIQTAVLDRGADHMTHRRRMARSLGFTGTNSVEARKYVERFITANSIPEKETTA